MEWSTPVLTIIMTPLANTIEPPTWSELGAYFVAILALGGSALTSKVARRNGREATAVTEVGKLWDRLDKLEELRKKDREEHEAERKADREQYEKERAEDQADRAKLRATVTETAALLSLSIGYIEQLITHFRSGGGEPLPTVPEQLRAWLGHLIHRQEH